MRGRALLRRRPSELVLAAGLHAREREDALRAGPAVRRDLQQAGLLQEAQLTRRRRAAIASTAVALATVVLACVKDQPNCYVGEYQGCLCADGGFGYAACAASQDGYVACVCDGTTPGIDSGTEREAGSGAGDGGGNRDAGADQ